MSNVYTAKLSNGESYDVSTDRHHTNHDEKTFKQHLLDVIKSSSSGVITAVVVHYVLKGKR